MTDRFIGLDVGDRTIGVAVSDGLGLTAQPVTTLRRGNPEKDMRKLLDLIRDHEAAGVVVGLPRSMDGHVREQGEKVLSFMEELQAATDVPVIPWDERLSSAGVQRSLIEADVSRARRKKVIHQMSAQWILQGYLDRKKGENRL